ncbi:MAG: restriction endonuclease [Lachnospiraceae bacterium]|nr:restriction endonuclease [Lachnospiraceae bacterium]
MREYKISEDDLNQIIREMQESNVIDKSNTPMMSVEEFERFVDIYEPGLFKCKNCVFDKKNFTDIGEMVFEKGMESVYDILPANEILDYLNIMESLKIISYDDCTNKYDILVTKEDFYKICKSVPNFRKEESNTVQEINIDNMEGHDFEYYCADVLRENGFTNVEVTKGSGDHGIDILAEKDDITYAIQCKCYASDIGNAAVQQAHTGKSIYKKDIAVVLTNRYFTAQAKEEAAALGVKLWDRDKLNIMIERANS